MEDEKNYEHVNETILKREGYDVLGKSKNFTVAFSEKSYKQTSLLRDRVDNSPESIAILLEANLVKVRDHFELGDPHYHSFVKVKEYPSMFRDPSENTKGYHDFQSQYRGDQEMSVIVARKNDSIGDDGKPSFEFNILMHEVLGHGYLQPQILPFSYDVMSKGGYHPYEKDCVIEGLANYAEAIAMDEDPHDRFRGYVGSIEVESDAIFSFFEDEGKDEEYPYYAACSIYHFVYEKYGVDKLKAIMKSYPKTKDLKTSFEEALGVGVDKVEEEWREAVLEDNS